MAFAAWFVNRRLAAAMAVSAVAAACGGGSPTGPGTSADGGALRPRVPYQSGTYRVVVQSSPPPATIDLPFPIPPRCQGDEPLPSRPFGVAVELVFERRGNEWVGRQAGEQGGLEVRIDVPAVGVLAPISGSIGGGASTTSPSAMPFGDSAFSVGIGDATPVSGAQFNDSISAVIGRPVRYQRLGGGSLTCQDAGLLILPAL